MNTNPISGRRVRHGKLRDEDGECKRRKSSTKKKVRLMLPPTSVSSTHNLAKAEKIDYEKIVGRVVESVSIIQLRDCVDKR